MTSETVFKKVDSLFPDYIEFWKNVCDIETPTLDIEAVNKLGTFYADFAKSKGFDVHIEKMTGAGDIVCITLNKDSKEKPITISGHIDTVHKKGLFGYPPTRVEGDFIYGPGVCDCKGGTVAGLLAMEALGNCGYDKRPVRLLLQTDEEMGSRPSDKKTIEYICETSKSSVVFINMEGNRARGNICVARKGIITYIFKIKGKKAHSSECAILGANAISEAAHKILELEKFKDDKGITVNCGVIHGGTVPNIVADECEFAANVRFATKDQLDFINDFVQNLANTVCVEGTKTELSVSGFRIMMEDCERNRTIISRLNEIFEKEGLETLVPEKKKGGSDAAYVTEAGIPCVDCIGVVGGYIHSEKEWADIPSLAESAKRICAIALDI